MKTCPTCKNTFQDKSAFCPHDGAVLEADLTSLVGTTLDGQYRINALLGIGGMGAVYRAQHILLGNTVAIKTLLPQMCGNPDFLRRFLREGQAAQRFSHPNAVAVRDLRTISDGMVYMVLEYVEGRTLLEELRNRGRFSPTEALAILEPVASVLNAAHAAGVVHRDLKPGNIMISTSSNGQSVVKLLDLGIAKVLPAPGIAGPGETVLTAPDRVLGTPHYMSPEQWGLVPRDGKKEIDGRADLYGLAVIFYELVAGRRPFEGETIESLCLQHTTTLPPSLHEAREDVSEAVSSVVMRAMAKDRDDRQANCEEFIRELRATLKSDGEARSIEKDAEAAADVSGGSPSQPYGPSTTKENAQPQAATRGNTTLPDTMPSPSPAQGYVPTLPEGSVYPITKPHRTLAGFKLASSVMAVLLVASGWLIWSRINPGKSTRSTPTVSETLNLMDYWLEIAANPDSPSERKAGEIKVASGRFFKMHFIPNADGYVYVLGPNEKNNLATFLTEEPASKSGIKTNAVKAGEEFSFPKEGKDHWIQVGPNVETDIYTIVFSLTPITSPVFFKTTAEHELTSKEHTEWDDFRAKAVMATTNLKSSEPASVMVGIPKKKAEQVPVIFDIRVEHK